MSGIKHGDGPLHEVVVSLGTNDPPRCRRILEAIAAMRGLLLDCRVSDIYETPEIHGYGDPYMNAVLSGRTRMDQTELERFSKQYEVKAGRDALARKEGRVPIDIDIVIWDGTVPQGLCPVFFQDRVYRLESQVGSPIVQRDLSSSTHTIYSLT